MSSSSPRSSRRRQPGTTGLPTWSGIAIVLAALITGLLLSINAQAIGWPFLLCFAVAGIVVALATEARGLFLTIAAMPLLFGTMTVLTSWMVGRSLASDGTPAFSTTSIVTAIYPLAQFFPVLGGVTLIAAIIAAVRIWLLRRNGRAREETAIEVRRRTAEADRRNRDTVSRARSRANQVTVEELLARNRDRDRTRAPREPREPQVRRRQEALRRAPEADGHRGRQRPVREPEVRRMAPRQEPRPELRPESRTDSRPEPRTREIPRVEQEPPAPPRRRSRRLDDDLYS